MSIIDIYKLFKKLSTEPTRKYDIESQSLNDKEEEVYKKLILGPKSSLKHYIKRKIKQFRHAFQLSQFKRFFPRILPKDVLLYEEEQYGKDLKEKKRTNRDLLSYIELETRKYFKNFKSNNTSLGTSTKSCVEGKQNYIYTIGDKLQPHTHEEIQNYMRDCDVLKENLRTSCKTNSSCYYQQVVEPLKIRSLTKMNAAHQILHGLQVDLKSYLDKDPCFSLTNNPSVIIACSKNNNLQKEDDTEKLDKFLNRTPQLFFTSGDYSSATDTIHSDAIHAFLRGIRQYLSEDNYQLLHQSFTNYSIYIEIKNKKDDELFTTEREIKHLFNQNNGQLMGSITSFPILCILNKFLYQYTQEQSNEPSSQPIINGDDILFRSTLEFHKQWRDNLSLIGFRPSPGKNLIHQYNFTINSRPFVYNNKIITPLNFINGKEFQIYKNLSEYILALQKNRIKNNEIQNLHFLKKLGLSLSSSMYTKKQTKYIFTSSPPTLGGFSFPNQIKKISKYQTAYQHWYVNRQKISLDPINQFLKRNYYPTFWSNNLKEKENEIRFNKNMISKHLHKSPFKEWDYEPGSTNIGLNVLDLQKYYKSANFIPKHSEFIPNQRPYTYTGINIYYKEQEISESCASSLQKY